MQLAPIVIFAFNRPDHLQRTLAALAANDLASKSAITFFCDGPRNHEETQKTSAVHKIAHDAQGFATKEIIARKKNMGCAASVIDGLAYMFAKHEQLIIIEDDIITSPHTLHFLNSCLDKYLNYRTVSHIAAWSPPPTYIPIDKKYPYDVYAIPHFNGWGWATWKDRWEKVDWEVEDFSVYKETPALQDAHCAGGEILKEILFAQMAGKVNAWDIRFDYMRFKHGCVGINPVNSYTTNIGCDGTGTHFTDSTVTYLDNNIELAIKNPRLPNHIFLHAPIVKSAHKAYTNRPLPLWKRILNKIRRRVIN